MRFVFGLITLLFVSLQAMAGVIEGKVSDEKNGEPIIGAIVSLKGTDKGAATDFDGNFTINVGPGEYEMEIKYTSYTTYTQKVIVGNETVVLDIKMSATETKLDEVVVTAKANKESETSLIVERQAATEVVQKIGAQEMTRKGVSNVAEGVTKVVGVSTSSTKVTVVRGLGDRYNNVTVNGLPIPSTNPDMKVLPLSIFPSGVIKNLAVSKSYSPQYYGDFAGATIDIVTKDYSEKPFLAVNAGVGFNSITTGKPFLYNQDRSLQSTLGFARDSRSMPAEVAATKYYDTRESGVSSTPFTTKFTPKTMSATPNYNIGLSGGNFHKFKKQNSGFGYFASLTMRNENRYSPGILALYNAQQSARYLYETDNYNNYANTTGLLSLTYKINAKNTIGISTLYVNDANNTWISARGTDYDLGAIYSRRNTYVQNTLLTNQLLGKHEIGKHSSINWGGSYSKTVGSMPDRLQNTFRINSTPNGETYNFAADAVSNNQRFFAELNDNEMSGKLEYEYKNDEVSDGLAQFTGGVNAKYKERTFRSRSIDMKIGGTTKAVDLNDIDAAFSSDKLGDGQSVGSFKYVESYYAPNDYDASIGLMAAYANAVYKFGKWQVIAGARVEYAQQLVYFKKGFDTYDAKFRTQELTGPAFMPAITIKRALTEKSNILFAASRTITRPQFVEVGPFRYNESFGTQEREGNPLLINGTNYNADLKYEFYPSNAEIISVNLLGKYMANPIELVIVPSADPLLTYVNTNRAYVAGIEVEYQRNLGKTFDSKSAFMTNSSVGFNATYLYSQIQIDDLSQLKAQVPIQVTNTSRPLMGASPYIINADYSYRQNWNNSKTSYSQFTLTYNVFGKRVYAAGSQGAGDIYEMPVNTLDFTVINKFKNGFSANLNVGNILNPDIVQKQYFMGDESLDVLKYKRGIDVSLTLGYQF